MSIIYATQVNSKRDAGDINGAMEASANAKKWATIGAIVGVVWIVIWMALYGFAVVGSILSGAASQG